MTKLTRDDLLRLASLAKLELSEQELDEFSIELNQILGYVEQLRLVSTDGLVPTNQVTGLVNVMRADIIKNYGYEPIKLLDNVPVIKDGLIEVKRMVGK